MTNLGVMYEFGQGTKVDINAAKTCYTKVAHNGCTKAKEYLKLIHKNIFF